MVAGNVGDNSVRSYCLHASEAQQLSHVANATPNVWSCYGTADNQSRADLQQHTLATQLR